ncbi:hypothetical protein BGZ79_004775 [Entomortierella chlamydospora]|nr:hypothetical protein BGZ79_004775 [Entomortierella chlamydospora]
MSDLPYDQIQVHSDQSVSIAAGVADVSIVGENLTWISTTRNYVLTHGDPSDDVEAENMAKPNRRVGPNSKVLIQLLDVSLMDAPSVTLSEQILVHGSWGSYALPYRYDFERIEERNTYSVSVRIEDIDSDELTWIFVPPCPN